MDVRARPGHYSGIRVIVGHRDICVEKVISFGAGGYLNRWSIRKVFHKPCAFQMGDTLVVHPEIYSAIRALKVKP